MSSRRTLILIAAIAVGALAAFAIFSYVGGIEDRASEDIEQVSVIRITQDIPQGLTGLEARDQGYLDLDAAIAQEFFPPTAVTDVETILSKVAATNVAANQVLVENMFVDPLNSQITNARRIPNTHVAVTISVDQVRGVAGLIVPGDYVNMFALPTENPCGTAEEGAPPAGEGATGPLDVICSPARMVYQGAQVLFVDRSPIPLPGEQTATGEDGTDAAPTNTGLLTLSVPAEAAQLIASVAPGQWYLTLLPNEYSPAPVPPIDTEAPLLPGEDPSRLTPYGPQGFESGTTP